jgi:redox-sensitive bicupin YhaK (pirin superfamily)
MFWDRNIPRHTVTDADGHTIEVTVIAGHLGGVRAPSPPPASWAARVEADVAIWHIVLEPGATWTLPGTPSHDAVRTLYVFEGEGLTIDDEPVGGATGAVVDAACDIELAAGDRVEILMLQARPLRQPVAQYGPFVMNTRAEIQQAFDDYQRTRFGGWPWDRDDQTHGIDETRFARHADGRVEHAVYADVTPSLGIPSAPRH